MLLSELKNLKFDLSDYPESKARQAMSQKLACDSSVILSADDLNLLDDSDFALVVKEGRDKLRKYPLCNTKTAAISRIFLQAHKSDLPETLYKLAERNINYFLTKGKSLNNTITTQELFAQEKSAGVKAAINSREKLADSDYAIIINNNDIKTRLYPINDEHNCKLASEYFSKNLNTIPLHLRHEYAKAIVIKCAAAGYDASIITDDIRSYCNNKLNPNFDLEITMRKDKLASAKAQKALDVLCELAPSENLIKIANLLHKFDKEFALDKHYNKSFSDAYRAVFNNKCEKTASVSIVGEYSIDPNTLAAMPYTAQLKQLFSEQDFNAIKSDPAAYEALPAPYKQAIQQQAG